MYTARAGWSTRVIDKGITAGALGMTSKISNFPGVRETIRGSALVEMLREQAEGFGAVFENDKVTAARVTDSVKTLWGGKGTYRGRGVVVTTGSMGRTQTLPGEERLTGRGVSYCATCDGFFFQDQTVVVAGSTDEVLEEALYLTRFARRVVLLSPAESLRASEDLVDEVEKHAAIDVRHAVTLREILGKDRVEGVVAVPLGDEPERIEATGVFIYIQGGKPIVDFLGGQIPVTSDGCLLIDETFQTQVPGVFAAGDVLCKHVKQAVIAAAEGAASAMAVDRYLAGRSKLRPDWS